MNRPPFSPASALRTVFFAAGTVLAFPVMSGAQHIGDILLQPVSGRIETGGIVQGASGAQFQSGLRVFRATFGEFPNFTDDPGFDTTGGTGFPNGTFFAFDILDALHKWDGTDFDAIPSETIRISKATTNVFTPAGLNQLQAGFTFGQVSSGFLHEHLKYTLLTPSSAGVYLLQLRVRAIGGGFQDSLPFWIVFNQNATLAEHDAAVTYMERLVTPPCPGDLNSDGAVNTADLTRFLGSFGSSVVRGSNGDFNGDTVVNTADLVFFLGRFGGVCP